MFRIIILSFLISSQSLAANGFLGLGASVRLVKDDAAVFKTKFPLLLYGGVKDIPWAYAGEVLYFQNKSDTGASFHIQNDHYEATAYLLRFFNYEDGRAINPYVLGGLGAFQSHITTNFSGLVDKDKSKFNPVAKLGTGAWAQIGSLGFINLEGKVMYSNYFSPEVVFDVSARAGLEF